jgi:hypothetical protein
MGTITILDLVLVTKTQDGDVVVIEIDQAEDPTMFDDLEGDVTGILSDQDALAAGEALDPGNTAAVIVWENTWARALVGAIRDAGGLLVAHDRLDAEKVNEALAGFLGAGSSWALRTSTRRSDRSTRWRWTGSGWTSTK